MINCGYCKRLAAAGSALCDACSKCRNRFWKSACNESTCRHKAQGLQYLTPIRFAVHETPPERCTKDKGEDSSSPFVFLVRVALALRHRPPAHESITIWH